jgi:tetratricopeptide (TPR) repeat protein
MKRNPTVTVVSLALLVALFAGSVLTLRKVETLRGKEATLEEILYLPSGKMLKRMSLGYSNLLADIYWTRAVQYFGNKQKQHSTRYDLLNPLLEITTDLDPHLVPAYQTGSIFLSQGDPYGAGQPDKAVALLEKGIRENPEYWRLYFTLGFIHYIDRRDYKAAEEAFKKGSEVPGALAWMKVMAARMAEHSRDFGTAIALWRGIYETNSGKEVRKNAADHLVSLQADADIEVLERRVQYFREKKGSLPSRWSDLISVGLLRGIPQDSTGSPYVLMPDGTVQVEDRSKFPFLGEFLQGQVRENK